MKSTPFHLKKLRVQLYPVLQQKQSENYYYYNYNQLYALLL